MKLFQQMLVAGAAMSLLAPLTTQASETINVEEMNSYGRSTKSSSRINSNTFINQVNEEIVTIKGRLDGLEAQQNDIEAGSFNDTTTMDGKAIFDIGGIDYSENDHPSARSIAQYSYTMNLNSSFTGDDNLYVRIKSGNHTGWTTNTEYGSYLSSAKGNSDILKVDKIWYQFPVLDNHTIWVGPKIENYYMHGTSPSIYKPITKQFTLGGNGEAYGASTDSGAGWAYRADNGFAISSNIGTKSNTTCKGTVTPTCGSSGSYVSSGVLTDETKTSWATQIGYTQPQYSVSALLNLKYNGWSDGYYHSAGHTPVSASGATSENYSSIGLRGWWRPLETGTATPSISLGYDTTSYDNATAASDESSAWFAGLTWEDMFQPDDRIGIAFGQPTTNEDETVDPFAYEVYYSFQANDSVTITPAIFGGSDRNGTAGGDVFGGLVQTTFKF